MNQAATDSQKLLVLLQELTAQLQGLRVEVAELRADLRRVGGGNMLAGLLKVLKGR